MRKLASIQKVEALRPIEGADRIEVATVLGWEVVVRKGQFQPGDLCCYIEIDSICPDKPWAEFLRERKFRVRTIKLRKQISQGLALTLGEVGVEKYATPADVGLDITEVIEVKRYDPEAAREKLPPTRRIGPTRHFFLRFRLYRWFERVVLKTDVFHGQARRGWPVFLPHTDEERVQNMPWVLKRPGPWYITEKLDGQSATYAVTWRTTRFLKRRVSTFYVCSRTVYKRTPSPCTWWRIAAQDNIRKKLESYGTNICVQGEIIGEGVQGNKYRQKGLKFYAYDVWDIDPQQYFAFNEFINFCEEYGFETVPVMGPSPILRIPETVPDIVELAAGTSWVTPLIEAREGIVVRTALYPVDGGNRLSFKVINPDFLLRYEGEDEARQLAEWGTP